jgi:hypothetical protein
MRISAAVGLPVAKLNAHLTQSFATSLLLVVGSCVSATLIIIIAHPSLWRAAMKEHNDEIRAEAHTGLQSTKIMKRLREQDLDIPILTRDIFNDHQHQRIEFLAGRTLIQALLYTLHDDGDWVYQYQTDDNDKVTTLFFSRCQCLELLRSNPFFLVMDYTYKTNKYKMPLLHIIGSTALGSMFFVAFCFLSSEIAESYGFALRCLKSMYQSIDLQLGPCSRA